MSLFQNAITILKKDHENVRRLFKKIMTADLDDRPMLFDELTHEIELHTNAEETIFYPAVEVAAKDEDEIETAYEDHERVRDLIEDISKEDITSDIWLAKVGILQDAIEEHVREEETVIMPKAEESLGKEALKKLGDELQAHKKRMESSPGELGAMPV